MNLVEGVREPALPIDTDGVFVSREHALKDEARLRALHVFVRADTLQGVARSSLYDGIPAVAAASDRVRRASDVVSKRFLGLALVALSLFAGHGKALAGEHTPGEQDIAVDDDREARVLERETVQFLADRTMSYLDQEFPKQPELRLQPELMQAFIQKQMQPFLEDLDGTLSRERAMYLTSLAIQEVKDRLLKASSPAQKGEKPLVKA